jgi:hypothetical protein
LNNDWRFVESRDIVDKSGYIEPYPGVWLINDPHWKSLQKLPEVLNQILARKIASMQGKATDL